MATQNIKNSANGQLGYQVPGTELPSGWEAIPGAGYERPVLTTKSGAGTGGTAETPSPVRRYTGNEAPGTNTYDSAAKSYYEGLNTSQPDEAAIRASALEAVRSQIDATENTYANILSNERTAGQNRLGQTRSVNARAGLLNSDFGNKNMSDTTDVNNAKEKAVMDEKNLKIQTILGQVNNDVAQKVKDQKALATANAEKRLTYLKDLGEKAKTQVESIAKAGGSVDQLSDSEYNHLLESTGYTPEEMKRVFILNKPKDEIVHQEVSGNKYFVVSRDPVTKALKTESLDIGFDVPQGYKVEKLDNGNILFYPDKFDPNKSTASQIFTYGGGGTTPSTTLKYTLSNPQKTSLIGLGFDPSAINSLESFLKTGTLDDALGKMQSAGKPLDDTQKKQIKDIFAGGGA